MILNMGERIRELRRERALTQEEVARRLNISAQAVSKWENAVSYPDLELLPPLSELLGVSIDALFREDAESETEDCCSRADELLRTPARAKEALPLLREAVIRRPFHAGLLGRLGTALYLAYLLPENLGQTEINEQGEETVEDHGDPALLREAAAVWERALNCEQQPDSRDGVVKSLIAAYALMEQREKARELAERQNKLSYAREILLPDAEEGEKKEEALANALLALFMQTAQTVLACTPGVGGILPEADDDMRILQAERCAATARLIEAFFPDGRCGKLHFILSQLWYYPAALYAALGDFEKADACFIPMARHERLNRAYGEGGAYRYTGVLFERLTEQKPLYIKYEPTKQPFTESYTAHIKETPALAALLD